MAIRLNNYILVPLYHIHTLDAPVSVPCVDDALAVVVDG